MSLATERERGLLICQCHRPVPCTVVLFGYWELVDVFECGRCRRPIFDWCER